QKPYPQITQILCNRGWLYFPNAWTHSALLCINGRNASRGTVISMCMLSSVLIFAPATAGPSFDSSQTNHPRTSASDFKSTRASSAAIRGSENRSDNRSRFNGALLPINNRSFPLFKPPTRNTSTCGKTFWYVASTDRKLSVES